MTRPVHFDLEAMRAQFLANADNMFIEAMKHAETDKDRLYVRAQKCLSPALTELMVRMADASNQGLPDAMIVRSIGITLGKMAGSAVASFRSNPGRSRLAMVDLAPLKIVQSPREYLSTHQIGLVRRLVQFGPATKVRGGWMLGGHYHRDKTLRPLIALDLAEPSFRWGKHKLAARHTARAVVETLAERSAPKSARAAMPPRL